MTYDYRTPWRTEEQADYTSPTQFVGSRNPEQNIEATVKWWLEQKIPGKILPLKMKFCFEEIILSVMKIFNCSSKITHRHSHFWKNVEIDQ